MEHNPLKDLRWLLLALACLWVVWFFTGGPARFESQAGPFLRPPTLTAQGEIYGKDVNLSTNVNISINLSSGINGQLVSIPCKNTPQFTRCNDTRSMKIKITKKKDGTTVRDMTIGSDGKFKIGLAPAEYIIWQVSSYSSDSKYQNPTVVRVRGFRYTDVKIAFDNRIR